MNPCSSLKDGTTVDETSWDGTKDMLVVSDEPVVTVGDVNEEAKIWVGVGVERYKSEPESGRKLFRGFSA